MQKSIAALFAAALIALTTSYAGAETDAQWKSSVFNRVSKCRTLWLALGDVPHDTNEMTRDTTFVCHPRFALSHDNVSKTPDWVLEKITKPQISGTNKRPSKGFVTEKHVPPHGRAVDDDYPPKAVGFARGHMAPSEDFNSSITAMKDTFVLSNVVPQIAPFNSGLWGQFEDRVRDAAFARQTIYVISGPVRRKDNSRNLTLTAAQAGCGHEIKIQGPEISLVCKANNINPNVKCNKSVTVPIALYKIIYDAKKSEVYAFLIPNRMHDSKTDDALLPYLDSFRVTVAAIESVTGLQFFRELPAAQQEPLLKQCQSNVFWGPKRPDPKKKPN